MIYKRRQRGKKERKNEEKEKYKKKWRKVKKGNGSCSMKSLNMQKSPEAFMFISIAHENFV